MRHGRRWGFGIGVRGVLAAACVAGVFGVGAAPAWAGAPEAPELYVEGHLPTPASPTSEEILHGILNPGAEGVAGTYQFLYKASSTGECEGGSVAPVSPGIAAGVQHEELPAETITGLTPGTEYAVCLLAESSPTEKTLSPAVSFTTAVTPEEPVTLSPAVHVTSTTATLEGVLNPHVTAQNGWYFEYNQGAACTGGQATSVEGEASVEDETVSKEVTELQPNAQYTFCLVATNEDGETTPSTTEVHFTTQGQAPAIESLSTPTVSATSAGVQAVVNPENEQTSLCVFEYGETTTYGNQAPCEPTAIEGFGGQAVNASITGLTHDTPYNYRIRVKNPAGESERTGRFASNPQVAGAPQSDCPNPGHTGLSGRLPDCRAYELMTPVDKGDSEDLFGETSEVPAGSHLGDTSETGYPDEDPAEEGDKFFLHTTAAFGANPASGNADYIFTRTPTGWQSTSLAIPNGGAQSLLGTPLFNPDFSQVAVEDRVGSLGNIAALRESAFTGTPGGPYTKLIESPFEAGNDKFAGASTNFERVFFQSEEHQFAAAAEEQLPESNALYEYTDGHYNLVNVGNNGKTTSECGAISPATQTPVSAYNHAVSSDGSRVFFISPDPRNENCYEETLHGFSGSPPQLYMRADGHTVEVSESQAGFSDPDGPQPVAFTGATPDGSQVFFVTRAELTADDINNHEPELYEYNTETGRLTRISSGDTHTAVGNVGWVVPSEDGSTVYFTAAGQLAPGAPQLPNGGGEEGEYNLYRYDTKTTTTTYITTVTGRDWFEAEPGGIISLNIRLPLDVRSDWESTPDGGFLLFAAVENITGYNTTDPAHCEGNIGGQAGNGGCAEVYRYDAANGSVICVSCNPEGALPTANALFDNNTKPRLVRAISNNGAYVFFDTSESLAPAATDEQANVYEWHEGEISLISSGQDSAPSYFLGTDPSGQDVYFGTHARLVPQDTDTYGDLYDARIDGGFPVPQGSAACEGDACQSPPPPPTEPTPGSLTFNGPGNLAAQTPAAPKPTIATKCKKGFAKKKGKCVKIKKKGKQAHNASHPRKTRR